MTQLPAAMRELNYLDATPLCFDGPVESRDVWLIDGSLPQAFDICRALPPRAPRILTAATTSFAHRKRCVDAGADALIMDPVDTRELADWLEHFDDHRTVGRAAVLIVDDDSLAAEGVAACLANCGIEAEIVSDPSQVFEVMERVPFDLVLMDLDMPGASGIDVARMIRQDRRYLSVPIVFLSADSNTETQMLARRFGGDDFISKRIDPGLLVRLIELRVDRARVIRALIERDGLTGLVDHRRFVERVGQELARGRRTEMDCTLAMIDLDHFKAVNDTWGHQAGDLVLRRLASSLSAWLRHTDVVGRYGGEEFGVLMLDTSPEQAAPVIEAFLHHFAQLDIVVPGATIRATFSAGLAGGRRASDAFTFIAAADSALYRAKSLGRNRVILAEPQHAAPGPQTTIRHPAPAAAPERPLRANKTGRVGHSHANGAHDVPTSS